MHYLNLQHKSAIDVQHFRDQWCSLLRHKTLHKSKTLAGALLINAFQQNSLDFQKHLRKRRIASCYFSSGEFSHMKEMKGRSAPADDGAPFTQNDG